MSRHSKNNTANPVFTYAERKMIKDFGNQNARIGSDSQRPFEFCNLCVSRVIDPHVCEKGHIFCKDCIVQNLVKQKKDNEMMKQAYGMRQQQIAQQKEQDDMDTQKQKELDFEKLDYHIDIVERRACKSKADNKIQGYIQAEFNEKVTAVEKTQLKGKEMLTLPKEELISKNFWVPDTVKAAEEKPMEAPRNCYRCPATKDHDIKFKKLYKMNLKDGGYPEASEFFCYACDKTLKFQKIGMSKHCGHVMCMTCVDKVCLPEGKCMVCSKPFMKKDIVNILEAYSGYTAHNQVEVKVFNPVMLI